MPPPLPSTWNTRFLASIATDLERLMNKLPDTHDAQSQLQAAVDAIEEADFYMTSDAEAA